ncbi:MAG: glycoside hydrolase family 25 protein, partial [Chloroflexi bacterium]|nr:glycoside hydrolase family 25 protein [Chloroflexota bacterium]
MFRSEKILLSLLVGICLIVSVVLVDAVIDPSVLIHTVYARLNDSPESVLEEIYVEGFEEEIDQISVDEVAALLQEGWDSFRNEGFAFEIQFPKQVVQKSILNQDALNAGVGVNPDAPVWQFRLDNPALYQGTNLEDASLLIHVLEGKDQEEACAAFKPGSIYLTPNFQQDTLAKIDINGVPFWKDVVIEGVMGEFYHRINYRTFSNGACYELTQLIHYRNITGIIEEEISEFDQELVIAELDSVLNTFSFLDVEPTFPDLSYPEPKTFSTAVAKNITTYVDGLDVSHWQGTINWTQVANANIKFTFAKGTEGVGWTDVKFHTNMNQGRDAGIFMGVYHFARPDLGNSGAAEANYFLSVAGDYLDSGYLRPVLDLEVGSSLGRVALSNWVLEWMETVKDRTGISPLIYTNVNFINNYLTEAVTEYDLWVAHWTCVAKPTYYYPNTGMYRDWAFWQYYGPGGCGSNAGFVPGITTNIDLNIFNGVEAGLSEYDASSNLWVSLSSDVYYAPAPYYADITGNVNGDITGVINYAFWWDCDALGADISAVEGVCGLLPDPGPGACLKNAVGQRCSGVTNELQLAEYTYQEIGDFTAKVIVERGGAVPAEDRYKITTYNPIRTVTLNPKSPAVGSVNNVFALNGAVNIHPTLPGVLQLSVGDPVTGEVNDFGCVSVAADVQTTKSFSLSWTEPAAGEIVNSVWTRYRAYGACPIVDDHQNDITQLYQIDWENENPILELQDPDGLIIPSGSTDDLGDLEPFQTITQVYVLSNLSTAADLQVSAIGLETLENVLNPQIEPSELIDVGPGEDVVITLNFEVQSSGEFSFDVVLEHDATNPT